MFTKSAPWYDHLYAFKDYAAASAYVKRAIQKHHPEAQSLLDVACGTGRHLAELGADYEVEGLDLNPDLLSIARSRCPEVPLHVGNMIDFDLSRTFDVVTCLFSSIAYVKTVDNMRSAVRAMKRHLAPGGILLIEPWFSPEDYWTGTVTANQVDEPELKIAWMYTSDEPKDRIATLDIHYLVGTPAEVQHFTEQHEFGLFTDDEHRAALEDVELSVVHDPRGPFARGMYIGFPADRAAALS
jgi:ubiquinone/menaquinone biosynthesis C-methylase UbiE